MKLKINNKEFNVKVARTEEEMYQGLRGVKELASNEGMLFIFDESEDVKFEMDGTLIDIDIIFIDDDKEIISIEHGKAGDTEDYLTEDDVKYVLEVNPGFKFKPGMEVEFDEGIDRSEEGMHIIDSDGTSQGVIDAGVRIFSRKNTRTIVKLAKDAIDKDTDVAYKKLGRKMFAYLDVQESNDPDYVEGK